MKMNTKEYKELYREAEEKIKNPFLLCIMVARRYSQLARGAPPLVPVDSDDLYRIALEELLAGKIHAEDEDELVAA